MPACSLCAGNSVSSHELSSRGSTFSVYSPVGSHGHEADFLFHSSIVAIPIPGPLDSQSLRWHLISGSVSVHSTLHMDYLRHSHPVLAHARSLSPSCSQLHSGAPLLLAGTPTSGFPFSSSVVHDRLMHLFCPLCRNLAVSFPGFSEPP